MVNDFISTLRTYLTKVKDGEKSPAEVASALNSWARESGEALKNKIEEEVERSVSKMGFIKREEFDALAREFDEIKKNMSGPKKATTTKVKAQAGPAKKIAAKKINKDKSAKGK